MVRLIGSTPWGLLDKQEGLRIRLPSTRKNVDVSNLLTQVNAIKFVIMQFVVWMTRNSPQDGEKFTACTRQRIIINFQPLYVWNCKCMGHVRNTNGTKAKASKKNYPHVCGLH